MAEIWKRAYLVRRNPRLSEAAFPRRWRQHSELGQTFPEVMQRNRRLAYCLVDHAGGARIGADATYDGIGLLWLRSPEALNAPIHDASAIPTMRRDELKVFHQHAFDDSVMLAETVLLDGPATAGIGVLTFVRRREGLSRDDFAAQWREAGRSLGAPRLRRHVRSTAVLEPGIAFDGLDEMWFDDAADAVAIDPGAGLVEPGATLRFLTAICHERVS